MKQTNLFTAAGCLVAGLAFAAFDAGAAMAPLPAGKTQGKQGVLAAAFAVPSAAAADAQPIVVARQGADDPAGHQRRGRGADNVVQPAGQGATSTSGNQRRGRGADNAISPGGQGADNPPGDVRRGRGRDDPPGHL